MRISVIFKEYCEVEKQYEEQGLKLPEKIKNEYETRIFIENTWLTLKRLADENAISKDGWKSLDFICNKTVGSEVSFDLKSSFEKCVDEVKALKKYFEEQDDVLLDGFTLSKKGRKRIRLACDIIGKLDIW